MNGSLCHLAPHLTRPPPALALPSDVWHLGHRVRRALNYPPELLLSVGTRKGSSAFLDWRLISVKNQRFRPRGGDWMYFIKDWKTFSYLHFQAGFFFLFVTCRRQAHVKSFQTKIPPSFQWEQQTPKQTAVSQPLCPGAPLCAQPRWRGKILATSSVTSLHAAAQVFGDCLGDCGMSWCSWYSVLQTHSEAAKVLKVLTSRRRK